MGIGAKQIARIHQAKVIEKLKSIFGDFDESILALSEKELARTIEQYGDQQWRLSKSYHEMFSNQK